ncbi:hypothetical protein M405DRAFT_819808 [Rhizopogon salebrosus TDB-379]|nr:hypothetical protein M405DRAFT_819808 [Rhizopogon salebrosus TDB-379]
MDIVCIPTENAKRPCVVHQLAVDDRYVASFPHSIVRARGSIDHHGCTKGVGTKTPSSLALHCHINGMVSSPTHTEIEVTD